jgi:hypothetical protein
MSVPRPHVGAVSEMLAAAYLLRRGYEVFRNVSSSGPIDLVAIHRVTGETRLFDVKTRRSTAGSKLTPEQLAIGVNLLLVEPDLGIVAEHLGDLSRKIHSERVALETSK